ncbi:MAG: IS21 family transposase [Limisphaerales bacterium]
MIDYQTFCRLRQLHDEQGLKASQIASVLDLDPKTVEKWVAESDYRPRQRSRRPSKLDGFKGQIAALLERHPYTAQQLLQQLRAKGYAGGYSILKDFVRQVRPVRKPAFLMLEFAPGECAQVDWGSFGSVTVGSTRRRLSFFVMVLAHSRLMYVEFTVSEGMEQFLSCHRHAFEFIGGVTEKVMIDNLKVGVLRHPAGEPASFHPRYLDLAAHYGFRPVACNVARGNEKGRVENGVGYVKKNFLAGLDIPSFAAVNPAAVVWRDTIANLRLHGETHRKPLEHFAEEKPRLRPLPVRPYDCAVVRPISANACCHVVLDTNRYSVPHLYASQKLTLKLYPDEILLYHHEKLIATHPRSYDRRQLVRNPDHFRDLLTHRRNARTQTLLLAFLALSPHAEPYARKLEDKRLNAAHHIRRIVALSEIHGPEKVDHALQDALAFEAIGSEYIANLLEQRERLGGPPSALHLTYRQDLLDLDLPPADLTPYEPKDPS